MAPAPKRIGVFLAVTGIVVGVYVVIQFLGKRAKDDLPPPAPVIIRFADIQCDVPAGADRAAFLEEVRYLGGFNAQINIADDKTREALRAAFKKHRDVIEVADINRMDSQPVRVRLRFKESKP